jgi:hypothetical protein
LGATSGTGAKVGRTTGLSRAQRLKQECHLACFQLFILQYLSAFAILDVELVRCNLLQHSGTSVFKEDNQAVTLDCDLSCAESVDCNTAGLVQAIQSFLHLDLYMFFI